MRLYRLLLRLLPPGFRAGFGEDMERLLEDRLEEAGSRWERARVWTGAVRDVLRHGPGEWLAASARVGSRMRPVLAGTPRDRPGAGLDGWLQDLRHGLRSLRGTPGFTLVATTTLALCIGANAAVFSVVDGVLLRPLPYHDPDRLVFVWPEVNFNSAMVGRVAEAIPALEDVSGVTVWSFTLTGVGEPEEVPGARVTTNHFRILGVQPFLGRGFTRADGVPGNEGVVILSYGLWVRRFGADPGILGRTIDLAGGDMARHTVIGVMPEDFRPVVSSYDEPRFWVPLPIDPSVDLASDNTWYINWRVGRLAPGARRSAAQEQLRRVAAELRTEVDNMLGEEEVRTATVEPLRAYEVADVSGTLWTLLGVVALVLLMGCANVANLLLARGEVRIHDLAVRNALGAGQGRLVRQLLTESAMLSLVGGGMGVLVAMGAVAALTAHAPEALPRARDIAVDGTVLTFTLGTSLLAVFLFGLAPAVRAARRGAAAAVRSGGRPAVSGRRPLARVLVATQICLAVVVLATCGLMLRSVRALYDVDPGFRPEGLVAFRTQPPQTRYPDAAAYLDYYDEVLGRVRALAAVEGAAGIQLLPGRYGNWSFPTYVEGQALGDDEAPPSINFRVITPGYFATMGIPLLEGRAVTELDRGDTEAVVVVNRALVERYWPGEEPLGREIRLFSRASAPVRVVGVVGDVRQRSLDEEPRPEMYFPAKQYRWGAVSLWIVARGPGDPHTLLRSVRDAVWDVDPDVPISYMDTLESVLADSIGQRRFVSWLLSAFALVALVLGVVGVYGVTAYTVSRRIPELGLRMALGARRSHLMLSALASTMGPVVGGIAVGLGGALLASRPLESLLWGVAPGDPTTLGAVAVLLGAAAMVATALPAWRAGRVAPADALRTE